LLLTRSDEPIGHHDYSNLAFPTLDAGNIIDKHASIPFALASNPLAHSWKSALVLGESGTTVPANLNSHLPSPGLFQPPFAEVKP